MFPGSGVPGSDFAVNTTTSGIGASPTVTTLLDGRFMVVWTDSDAIRGQVFTGPNAKDGNEFVVNTSAPGAQGLPIVSSTTLSDGRVVVTWTDINQHPDDISSDAVRGQILDPRNAGVRSRRYAARR